MLKLLEEDEKILMLIRRHWFAMARPVTMFFLLLIAPSVILTVFSPISENWNSDAINNLINFFLALYILSLLLFLFIIWTDYYLDIWIITSKRIIDVEQKGLFNRSISEFSLANVQDVTIEINGIVETLLKFGDLNVQTAGQMNFVINQAPNLYEAKDLILKYAELARKKINSNV